MTSHPLNKFCVCTSPSQVGEQCDGSRYVSAQSHFRGMDGKSRKLESAKGVVNTPRFAADERACLLRVKRKSTLMTHMDPELHCGPISMTQKNGTFPVLTSKVCRDEAVRMRAHMPAILSIQGTRSWDAPCLELFGGSKHPA